MVATHTVRLVNVFTLIVGSCHWFGCLWFLVGFIGVENDLESWLLQVFNIVTPIFALYFTHVYSYFNQSDHVIILSIGEQYIHSLYYVIMIATSIGSQTHAYSTIETIFSAILVYVSGFGYYGGIFHIYCCHIALHYIVVRV